MREKNFGIVIFMLCILVSFTAFSIPAEADSNTKFYTTIYGSLPSGINT